MSTIACSLSMATVNPNSQVCQSPCCSCGDGGSSCVQSTLNTVGKFGLSLAGVLTGRPTVTTNKGVSVGSSAAYASQVASTPNATVIVIVVVLAAVLVFFWMRR